VASSANPRITLDACCFLLLITGQPGGFESKRILDAVWDGRCDLVESPAILVEVLPRHPSDDGSGRRATVRAMLESRFVQYIELSTTVANIANDLTVRFPKVRGMDSIHLATAIFGGCELFVTTNTNEYPMGETVNGVLILTPADAGERLAHVLNPARGQVGEDHGQENQPTLPGDAE